MIQPEPEGSTQGYPLDSVEVLRFDASAGNPVKEILLKLNLPDHRILKDGGEELQRNEFASQRLPQREGNMNGWLIKDEDEPLKHEASDKELDSDLESTTSSKPKCKKLKKTSKAIPNRTLRDCPYCPK
ncbi:hypothetical protein Tco_0861888 [Tanacetum coccineum]